MIHSTLTASGRAMLPEEPDCLSALTQKHKVNKQNILLDEFNNQSELQLLRNINGMAAPLTLSMERFAAKRIERLPFLRSSNLMDDVLTGRYEQISFSDFLNGSQLEKPILSPHIVMEQQLGLYI